LVLHETRMNGEVRGRTRREEILCGNKESVTPCLAVTGTEQFLCSKSISWCRNSLLLPLCEFMMA